MPISVFIAALKVTVCPFLFALSVLFIIDPRALIDRIISAHELSLPMLCVILPVADVIATIRVDHATKAIVLIARPVSIIAHTIWPHLATLTMLLLSCPMTSVKSSIFNFSLFSFQSVHIRINQHSFASYISILEISELSKDLFNFGIVVGIDPVSKL